MLVFNGDVLSGHDIGAQLALHAKHDAAVTLYLTEVDDARAFGCVPVDAQSRVTAFLEKMPEPVTNLINAGCYVFRRDVIDTIPYGQVVSVERETFPQLLVEWRDSHGIRRLGVLARSRNAGRVRARVVRSGARHRAVARIARTRLARR